MPIDRNARARLRKKHTSALRSVGVALTNEAKELATRHTDNGTRRNSITHTITNGVLLWGIPRTVKHAIYLELGFRPHWVPGKYIGLWMQRNKVGVRHYSSVNGVRKDYKSVRAVALGLFVGGSGSSLQSGPGGTSARFFGKHFKRYRTKGGVTKDLPAGTVGHPILRPVIRKRARVIIPDALVRGWQRG